MYHDYSRQKGNDYIVDLLEERYIVKKIQINELKISDIQKYVLSLKESVKHWYYLHNPTLAIYDDQIKLLLDKLYRLNYGAFTPLLMSIFSRDDKYNITEVCNLLKLMEKYIFVIFRISQRRSNTGDSEFYGYARKYFQKALSIENIIGTADPVNDKFSGINWWYASYIDIKQFKIYLAEKFKNQDGYYSWSGLSYFLFEYELSLKQQSRNSEIMIHWQAYNEAKNGHRSIEHVMPQALVEQCWKESFSQFDTKQIKNLCNTIGNLTPLSVSKNSALQNYCFEIKKNGKTDEDMVGYSNGSYAEREISKEPQWTINEIKQRGIKLLKFMADHWEIEELKNPDLQENLLFLP
ncbi:HNH endonuclease family protein, partial [Sulfuricurvum sp.]|uniref:HNH endonuclease family protein n=1 Tax=Sulfuricurvum sp. TaxID=2025608 RepID=UPI003BB4C268